VTGLLHPCGRGEALAHVGEKHGEHENPAHGPAPYQADP
jgi:hypothetical protein